MSKKNGNDDDGQEDLFDENGEAYARWSDPDTSHEAAEEVRGETATRLEWMVVETIRDYGRGTMHDVSRITHVPWNTISPRFKPLCRKKLIYYTGEKWIGPFGKRCRVYDLESRRPKDPENGEAQKTNGPVGGSPSLHSAHAEKR